MKNIISIIVIITAFLFTSCNNQTKEKKAEKSEIAKMTQEEIQQSEGYKLMKEKCFICHFEKPDPAKMNEMIAPPMLRIKEHYLPSYQDKESFVNAIVSYVQNPSEEKTLMPGAVKKFKLMPKLNYDEKDLKLIAETLYYYDLDTAPKVRMQMTGDLRLNNGEPWKLKKETIEKMDKLIDKLYAFKSDNIKDYNDFGKELFDEAKYIMLDKSYTGEKFEQIHNFFNGIEDDMHSLISEKSINNAKKTINRLKEKFNNFYNYFEAEN